jgi:hypothetical protein
MSLQGQRYCFLLRLFGPFAIVTSEELPFFVVEAALYRPLQQIEGLGKAFWE